MTGSIAPGDPRSGAGRPPVRELAFGSACFAVNLQIRPPDATRTAMVELRERMRAATGLEMHFAPAATLHLTAFSVVYVRALYPTAPDLLWSHLEAPVGAALRALARRMAPFVLGFDRAGLRGDAVIVEADPDPRLEAVRDAVETAMAGIAPVFRTATTHSTIARLAQPAAAAWTRPLGTWLPWPTLEWPVDELRLVLERRYPALDETELERFPLAGG